MEPYETSIMRMIPGKTPREKYEHLLELMKACTVICFPRRGTWEDTATLQDMREFIEPHIESPYETVEPRQALPTNNQWRPLIHLSVLKPGDLVRQRTGGESYMVTANYGNRVIAVATADVTNPAEWEAFLFNLPKFVKR